jgi:hypothetical protein
LEATSVKKSGHFLHQTLTWEMQRKYQNVKFYCSRSKIFVLKIIIFLNTSANFCNSHIEKGFSVCLGTLKKTFLIGVFQTFFRGTPITFTGHPRLPRHTGWEHCSKKWDFFSKIFKCQIKFGTQRKFQEKMLI